MQFLINYARSFIYTTALPTSVFELNYAVASSGEIEARKLILQNHITYFRSKVNIDGLISDPSSPIQIIEVGDVSRTQLIAARIQDVQIAIKPIYSPTVPEGRERLRICIHSFNTSSEIDELARLLGSKKL
jgi:8-amino-7-oxononanoate synthase